MSDVTRSASLALDDRPISFAVDWPEGEIRHPSPWLSHNRDQWSRVQRMGGWREDSFNEKDPDGRIHASSTSFYGGYLGANLLCIDGAKFGYHYKLMRNLCARLSGHIEVTLDEIMDPSRWRLIKSEDSDQAEKVLEFTRWSLNNAAGWLGFRRDLADAPYDGFVAGELRYQEVAHGEWRGKWTLSSAEDRDMWHFAFVRDERGEPRLKVRTSDGLIDAPPIRILSWAYGGGSPWGYAKLDRAWPQFHSVLRQRHNRDIRGNKWAQPSGGVGVVFADGDSDEIVEENKSRLKTGLALARNMYANTANAWDEKVYNPKFLGVQIPGDDGYTQTLEDLEGAIAYLLRGEVQTSGSGRSKNASRASDIEVRKITGVMVKLLREALKERLNCTALRYLAVVNWGPDAPQALYDRQELTAEDQRVLMAGVRLNREMGRDCPENHLANVTGVPEPAPGEKCSPGEGT